uniref:Uncharacterized protein n=1 Tax=Setaria digitata TaxID=48799 RepID=A0A915Q373_9BILA
MGRFGEVLFGPYFDETEQLPRPTWMIKLVIISVTAIHDFDDNNGAHNNHDGDDDNIDNDTVVNNASVNNFSDSNEY